MNIMLTVTQIGVIVALISCIVLFFWCKRMQSDIIILLREVRQLITKEIEKAVPNLIQQSNTMGHFVPYKGYIIKAMPTSIIGDRTPTHATIWEPQIYDNNLKKIMFLSPEYFIFHAIDSAKQYINNVLLKQIDDTNTENTEPAKPQG